MECRPYTKARDQAASNRVKQLCDPSTQYSLKLFCLSVCFSKSLDKQTSWQPHRTEVRSTQGDLHHNSARSQGRHGMPRSSGMPRSGQRGLSHALESRGWIGDLPCVFRPTRAKPLMFVIIPYGWLEQSSQQLKFYFTFIHRISSGLPALPVRSRARVPDNSMCVPPTPTDDQHMSCP